MPKRTSAADDAPVRVVIVTLDRHLAGAVARAEKALRKDVPGLTLSLHAASEWAEDPAALEQARDAVGQGDIIIVTMLFMDEHIRPILPALKARRDSCDAMAVGMSAGEVIRLTRLGKFEMGGKQGGAISLLKRLRGGSKPSASSGAKQMAMLRRLPRLLRFIPGTAQDVRAYFLTLQYWLAGSDRNVANMVRLLVDRYAAGSRAALRGKLKVGAPVEYPDVGVYHPRCRRRVSATADKLPAPAGKSVGTVGLLVMRSYVLAGDTAHYDAVITALEARGLRVIPAFASGLDARPAVEKFFRADGKSTVDAVLSLTGFSLVGGPAYNDAAAAEQMLAELDVPYLSALAVEFQSLDQWQAGERGLMPIEATMMVAIPELDGATGSMVFGGRASGTADAGTRAMRPHPERVDTLAGRVARLIELRRRPRKDRRLAIVLYNFPPNSGSTGSAAHLSVYASLLNTLRALAADGYDVEVPENEHALREKILEGNRGLLGTEANVHARIEVDDHVRREPWLAEIESQWGPAPGKQQSDGRSIFVLGAEFGQVLVGIQPAFGYEGDPMRLLFEAGFTPTHAFSAFYRYLREDFGADAVLHFGTHGALEFMPGKQAGLSGDCWPDRLIGDLPNFYLYAANNPSEGAIAKRRSAATLISYLTPPIAEAGLYKGLSDLKDSIARWRGLAPDAPESERDALADLIRTQAEAVDLVSEDDAWSGETEPHVAGLWERLFDFEQTLIPHGLHVLGEPPTREEKIDLLCAVADAADGPAAERTEIEALVDGNGDATTLPPSLAETSALLSENHELPSLLHALDGGFVRPAPGGDLLRTPAILPTGRNIHGFDPFRIPSAFAVADGARQAQKLLDRHGYDGGIVPEAIAIVLWGSDNLKSEGAPMAQALALMGARPSFDSYGRLSGAELVPLAELGRPRIDVLVTLSGIFRDLLPLQTRMLAEAAYLAASADEPVEQNFIRKHALAYQASNGCDLETAALRIFSNAEGAYGSNVNHLVDSARWDDEDELAEAFTRRKSFAYGRSGKPAAQAEVMNQVLGDVELTYQNLESVELGVTTIDHYFDTLGGIGKAVERVRGENVPAYIGDQTQGEGKVRTLSEQVELEARTRMLNPSWYEPMLRHGYEGVRQIEAHVTNTLGWSATTGQVDPWVYQQLTQTFVLDEDMRNRLAALNPKASVRVANRLLEAHQRNYWSPDEDVLESLRSAGEQLEDRLEGIGAEAAA